MNSLKQLNFGFSNGDYYDASTKEQVSDNFTYKNYLRVNKTFYDYFRKIGDIQSSNTSYVRIRDIESKRLEIESEDNPSFKNYFNLKLNHLLKFYTNYGTEPARALVVSFYIILFFGCFYFFFPSEWDKTSKSDLFKNYKEFVEKNDKGYLKPFFRLTKGLLTSLINAV